MSSNSSSRVKALEKIVKRLPAQMIYYGSALGAIVLAGGGQLPPGLEFVAGGIGANLLSNLVDEIARSEDVLDDEIRQRAEEAINKSNISNLLTKQDFLQGYARLIQRLDAQKIISQDIIDELRSGFETVATAKQVIELKTMIQQFTEQGSPVQNRMPSVFISYRRADGREFAERIHNDLQAQGIDAWLDVRDMPSGDTFIAQIDRAIERADYFLLVATPQAIESDYCRDEWKKALEKYKSILPLMLMGSFEDLPREAYAYLNDARDFRDVTQYDAQLARLIEQIRIKPSPPGASIGVPRLPSYYLPRPDILTKLRDTLTMHKTTVLTSPSQKIGIQGMGGVGKSVLASAIASDYFVRRSFKDGIFWLTFGTDPRLHDIWKRLAGYLDQERNFTDWEEARDFFEEQTQDKECLIILDDLWQSHHANAFLNLGDQCRLFVTSRQARILAQLDAHTQTIGVLGDAEAHILMKQVSKRDPLPSQADNIITACGNLPLALAMIGAMVRGKPGTYWQDALEALQDTDLEDIMAKFPDYPYPNLFAAFKVSIDALDDELCERYYDFAIFPDDVAIPEEVPHTFWKPLTGREVRKVLDELVTRNLMTLNEDGSMSLHDLQLTYLRKEASDITARHQRLINNYNPRNQRWYEIVQNGYLFEHLTFHLLHAGDIKQVENLGLTTDRFQNNLFTLVFTHTIAQYYKNHQKSLDPVLRRWLSQYSGTHVSREIVVNVAISCGIEQILVLALEHDQPEINSAVIQEIHEIWKHSSLLCVKVLTALSHHITVLRFWRIPKYVDTLLRCSLILILEDSVLEGEKSTAIKEVQKVWQPVIRRLLFVRKVPLIERQMRRVRKFLLRLLINRIIATLKQFGGTSGQFLFNFQDLDDFFPANKTRIEVFQNLMGHLHVSTNAKATSVDDLIANIEYLARKDDNDLLTTAFALAISVIYLTNDPLNTTRKIYQLLKRLADFYSPTYDPNKPTASIWFPMLSILFLNAEHYINDRQMATEMLEMATEISIVRHTRYLETWKFQSGTIIRTAGLEELLWGYKLGDSLISSQPLKLILDFLIANDDHSQLRRIAPHFAFKATQLQIPEAGRHAIFDTVNFLRAYLEQLETTMLKEFWWSFTEGIEFFASRYKDQADKLIKEFEEGTLPHTVITTMQNAPVKEDFDAAIAQSFVKFVGHSIKNRNLFVFDLIYWATTKALETDSLKDWVFEVTVHLANLIYLEDTIFDKK
jgi:hypothetical protein